VNALTTPGLQHLIAGLAIIGAMSAMAATGTITGTEAISVIGPVGGLLLGGTLATSAATQGATAALSIPPAAPTPTVTQGQPPAPPPAA
jgi:hypothetical protein